MIIALAAWGNSRLDPSERTMILVDATTGAEVDPVVVDRATGRKLDTEDFIFTAGPAASAPFRARYPTPSPGEQHSRSGDAAPWRFTTGPHHT